MMFIGINSNLSRGARNILQIMGHGDEITIVDGNYPVLAHACQLICLDRLTLFHFVNAVLRALPIANFNAIHHQIVKTCKSYLREKSVAWLVSGDFYAHVINTHNVISTSELHLCGNLTISEGVIFQTEGKS
jgi:L-fucose mutarotase/ribose pyranase (RbsD/FucU family)